MYMKAIQKRKKDYIDIKAETKNKIQTSWKLERRWQLQASARIRWNYMELLILDHLLFKTLQFHMVANTLLSFESQAHVEICKEREYSQANDR